MGTLKISDYNELYSKELLYGYICCDFKRKIVCMAIFFGVNSKKLLKKKEEK